MKRNIFIALLLTLASIFVFVMPVAAGDSKVVSNESDHSQIVDKSVEEGEDGYYEVTTILHDNEHQVTYSDETWVSTGNWFYFLSVESEDKSGISLEYDRHEIFGVNNTAGNGFVMHIVETITLEDKYSDSRYHKVAIYATGETRVFVEIGEPPFE